MKEFYPYAVRHYNWFRRAEAGKFTAGYLRPSNAITGEGYRWRGSIPRICPTSGLDHYPRAKLPHPGELHVDTLAWVGGTAHILQQVTTFSSNQADADKFAQQLSNSKHNLHALHWSPDNKTYGDLTVDAEIKEYVHVYREGYLFAFPLLLDVMDSTHLNVPAGQFDLIADELQLWPPYRLRSLSASNPAYHTRRLLSRRRLDEPECFGCFDMGCGEKLDKRDNASARKGDDDRIGFQRIAIENRALELAAQLRERLVDTVFVWVLGKTRFFWEQYHGDFDGHGLGSREFTGWTACCHFVDGVGV